MAGDMTVIVAGDTIALRVVGGQDHDLGLPLQPLPSKLPQRGSLSAVRSPSWGEEGHGLTQLLRALSVTGCSQESTLAERVHLVRN